MKLALIMGAVMAADLTNFTTCSKTGDLEDYGTVMTDCDTTAVRRCCLRLIVRFKASQNWLAL